MWGRISNSENVIQSFADYVSDCDVALLNFGGHMGRDCERGVGQTLAGLPCQGNCEKCRGVWRFGPPRSHREICAGADREEDIVGSAVALPLTGEDLLKAVIVANGSEGDGWERSAFPAKTAGEFGGDWIGVRGASSVAAGE